jgi:GTP-binding protein
MYGAEENLKAFKEKIGRKHKIIPVSAITGDGLNELKKAMFAVLEKLPPVQPLEFEEFNYVKPDRLEYEIFKEGETFVIVGTLIDVLKRNVVMDDMNSLAYMHKVLRDRGIIKQLRAMGATDESTVIIGGEEFEFVD